MKALWNMIEKKKWTAKAKYAAALLLLGAVFALAGFALWMVIRLRALSSVDWMLCFIGYPVVISWIAIFLYSCRHEFHDGVPER